VSVPDPAKVFLEDFLKQLQVLDKRFEASQKTQLQLVQQQQQMVNALQQNAQQLNHVANQLQGLNQRCEHLYDQMGRLGEVMVDCEPGPSLPGPAPHFPTIGQVIDSLSQGGGRRRRGR
jgi:TolA-binding protein